jgi:phosphoglucosamine mutase
VHVRFGTDGIRGVANVELTVDVALALGRAVASVLPADQVVVGRDTRRSGAMLQAAVTAGLASRGVDVVDVGVLPTPAVAWAAARRGVPAVMVSASHNPFADNGLKVFGHGGRKLCDADERALEAALAGWGDGRLGALPAGTGAIPTNLVGTVSSDPSVADGYLSSLVDALEGRDLAGLRVVVDCAHGAASVVAPAALRRLGADVTVLGAEPDGTNINEGCGSTHPEALAEAVVAAGAALGLALDGDADRLVAVDHRGRVVTGDHLLVLFATDLHRRGALGGGGVVVTVMSNLGLRLALAELGIGVHETPVGDRYVLEALDAQDLVLGGEQSGHIVFRSLATTGDGVLTGVLLADLVRRAGDSLADLADRAMTPIPQHLVNVRSTDPAGVAASPTVRAALEQVGAVLGDQGRVLVRPSGTEPLVRVMVEAVDGAVADQVLAELCRAVESAAAAVVTP